MFVYVQKVCDLLDTDNCSHFSAGHAVTRRDIVPAIETHFVSVIVEDVITKLLSKIWIVIQKIFCYQSFVNIKFRRMAIA